MRRIHGLRRWHRWHALAMSLIVIASAGSGLLHTWMARTQPPPPAARPAAPFALSAGLLPPDQALAELPGPPLSATLRPLDGGLWWQIQCAGSAAPVWRDARTGVADPGADARYAATIAGAAAGGAAVSQTGYLTAFDREYIAIFRILPVYRFAVDDGRGTRLYVSTATASVTRATDDRRQFEADVFGMLHKWNFIPWRGVRDWALIIAMAGIIAVALGGIALFVATARRKASASQDPG
jgi:hypothetical protein